MPDTNHLTTSELGKRRHSDKNYKPTPLHKRRKRRSRRPQFDHHRADKRRAGPPPVIRKMTPLDTRPRLNKVGKAACRHQYPCAPPKHLGKRSPGDPAKARPHSARGRDRHRCSALEMGHRNGGSGKRRKGSHSPIHRHSFEAPRRIPFPEAEAYSRHPALHRHRHTTEHTRCPRRRGPLPV